MGCLDEEKRGFWRMKGKRGFWRMEENGGGNLVGFRERERKGFEEEGEELSEEMERNGWFGNPREKGGEGVCFYERKQESDAVLLPFVG